VTILHVQSTGTGAGFGASPATISLSGVAAGNRLFAIFSVQGGVGLGVSGITDGAGNTWVKLLATVDPSSYSHCDTEVWTVASAVAGTTALSIAYTGTPYVTGTDNIAVWFGEYSGVGAVDVAAVAAQGSSTSASATTSSAAQSGDLALVVGILTSANLSAPSASPGSPWTNETISGQVGTALYLAWQVMPSTTAVTATWTITTGIWATIKLLMSPAASVPVLPNPVIARQAVKMAASF
jgi:hypothetical protein